jgi:hypothetical protein
VTVVHGIWKVVGKRAYRGHHPGEEFDASLEAGAATRAIGRGDIVLLDKFEPAIPPGSFHLPEGWTE